MRLELVPEPSGPVIPTLTTLSLLKEKGLVTQEEIEDTIKKSMKATLLHDKINKSIDKLLLALMAGHDTYHEFLKTLQVSESNLNLTPAECKNELMELVGNLDTLLNFDGKLASQLNKDIAKYIAKILEDMNDPSVQTKFEQASKIAKERLNLKPQTKKVLS